MGDLPRVREPVRLARSGDQPRDRFRRPNPRPGRERPGRRTQRSKLMNHPIKLLGWAALVAACAVAPLGAQGAPAPQALVLTADNLMAGDARHQELAKQGRDSATVLPGDVIRYRLRFTNVTDAPVRNGGVHNPPPGG